LEAKIRQQEERHAETMDQQRQVHQDEIRQWKDKHQQTMDANQRESALALDQLRQEHKDQLLQLEADHQERLQHIQTQTETKAMEDARIAIQVSSFVY
jgi:hypothetical protein